MITCPNCGRLDKDEVQIYNENIDLRMFNLLLVFPICRHCLAIVNFKHTCLGGNILAITGTSGCGKSTVAGKLTDKGFHAIDGDNVIQLAKMKNNLNKIEFNSEYIYNEIVYEIDVLSLYTDKIVLLHIFIPEDIDRLIAILAYG
ncbi:MAG: hypothetical protein SCM11_11375 [Bacillota bacterium]|nr:hypothetical protein [Bacillota bacterium]